MVYPSRKLHILFYSNGLAMWHRFHNIWPTHTKVNNSLESAILYLNELTFFTAFPSLKQHILLYSNGLHVAIWLGLPDIRHFKPNYG